MDYKILKDLKFYQKRRLFLTISTGIFISFCIFFSIFLNAFINTRTSKTLFETEKINHNIVISHLWLEEYLNGDHTIDINKDVLALIHDAKQINSSLITQSFPLPFLNLDSYAATTVKFQQLDHLIQGIQQLTTRRINDFQNTKSGSAIDQKYDDLFSDFNIIIKSIEDEIKEVLKKNQNRYAIFLGIMMLIVLGLIFAGITLYLFYTKKITAVYYVNFETERKLMTLTNNLKGMVYRCKNDKDYTMLFVSSGSTELTGYTPEELVNNKITSYGKLIVDKDLDLVSKAIQESNQKHGHFEMIYRIKTKSEKIKYVWERGIEINTNSSDDHILEGFITDITAHILDKQNLEKERKAAETLADEAQKANRAKSQFLANISHEIRTPLNGIIGFSTLLHDSKLEDTQQEYAEYVYASGKRLLEIVNNILDFSKITDNNITFHERKVDIKSNLHKTALILSDQIQKKNLEYHIFIDETLPELISIDALKLNQTIMNLLGNALKFTEKGSIEFHAEFLNQKNLYIYVRDTGIGISEENQKLIFDYFTQADGSLTRKYGGTGIGLTLSKQIIEKMGGTLQVKSKIGEGSTFYFKIPIHELECDAYD